MEVLTRTKRKKNPYDSKNSVFDGRLTCSKLDNNKDFNDHEADDTSSKNAAFNFLNIFQQNNARLYDLEGARNYKIKGYFVEHFWIKIRSLYTYP